MRIFMLPLCQDCQEKIISELNLNQLSMSFANIKHDIEHTLMANHILQSNFETLSAAHDETLLRVEQIFDDIKKYISNVTNINKNSNNEISNKLSTLVDNPAITYKGVDKAVTAAAEEAMNAITQQITIDMLPKIMCEFKE